MHVITMFILLFLLTLSVEGTNNANNTSPSGKEKNSNSLNSGNIDTISTSVSSTSSTNKFTRNTTKFPVIQNTRKCENNSVGYHPADTDTNTGNRFYQKLDLQTIFTFLLGALFSTVIFSTVLCFVAICKRCRATNKNTDNTSVVLEAVRSEHDQADEHDPLQEQTPAKISTNTTLFNNRNEEKILGEEQTEVTEVNYATINYSRLPQNDNGDLKVQKVESDYAEIQLKESSEEAQTLKDGVKQDEENQDQKGEMEKLEVKSVEVQG